MSQGLVLVWFPFGLWSQCPLSALVPIPCSQLGISILADVRLNSLDKGLSGGNTFLLWCGALGTKSQKRTVSQTAMR